MFTQQSGQLQYASDEMLKERGFPEPALQMWSFSVQEVVTQSGQLQYASEQMLKERSFASRTFVDGRKRFVVPIEEIEAAFWACPAGLNMKVSNKCG